jgi:hypothetical protein
MYVYYVVMLLNKDTMHFLVFIKTDDQKEEKSLIQRVANDDQKEEK